MTAAQLGGTPLSLFWGHRPKTTGSKGREGSSPRASEAPAPAASPCGQSPGPVGCPGGGLGGTLGDESALAPAAAAARVSSPHQEQRPGCRSLAFLLQALGSNEQLPRDLFLPLPRPQPGRSVGEKAGEQASWQWGCDQHHEPADSAREPQRQPRLPARGLGGRRPARWVAEPAPLSAGPRWPGDLRSPPFLAAAGAGQIRPALPPRKDPLLWFSAAAPAAPLTLAAPRCSRRAEEERLAGPGIPSPPPSRRGSFLPARRAERL